MFVFYSLSTLFLAYPIFHMISRYMKIDLLIFNIFFVVKFVYLLLHIYAHYNNFGTDSIAYFNNAYNFSIQQFPISENLIYGINYFFKEFLHLNYESLNVITFFISFSSCILLLSLTNDIDNSKKFGIYVILLFPSLNYFTSGLNKDMLIFFGLSLFLFSLFKKKIVLFILSLVLIFLVRPYVCFSILFAIIICSSLLFLKKIIIDYKMNLRFFLTYFISASTSLIVIYYISDNLLGSFGRNFLEGDLTTIINNLQSHYANTSLGIPIDTNIYLRILDYIFFPALWHLPKFNLFFIILIFENTLLLIIIINCFYGYKFFKIKDYETNIALFSFFILFLILAVVTSNHGIAFRQKWMFLPFLITIISQKSK